MTTDAEPRASNNGGSASGPTAKISLHMEDLLSPLATTKSVTTTTTMTTTGKPTLQLLSPTELTVAETPSPHGLGANGISGNGSDGTLSPPSSTVHVKKLVDEMDDEQDDDEGFIPVVAETPTTTVVDQQEQKHEEDSLNKTSTPTKLSGGEDDVNKEEDVVGGAKPFDESPSATPPKPFDEDFEEYDDLSTSSAVMRNYQNEYRQSEQYKEQQPSKQMNHYHSPFLHQHHLQQHVSQVQRRISYDHHHRGTNVVVVDDDDVPDDEREPSPTTASSAATRFASGGSNNSNYSQNTSRNYQDRKAQLNYVLSRMMQDVPDNSPAAPAQVQNHHHQMYSSGRNHQNQHHLYDEQPSMDMAHQQSPAAAAMAMDTMADALMTPTFTSEQPHHHHQQAQPKIVGASSLAMIASTIQPTKEPKADDEKLQKLQELSALISEPGDEDGLEDELKTTSSNVAEDRLIINNSCMSMSSFVSSTMSFSKTAPAGDVDDRVELMRPSTPRPAEMSARSNRTYGPESPGTPPADLPSLSMQTSTPPPTRTGNPPTPGTSPILPATPSHMIDDNDSVYIESPAVVIQKPLQQKLRQRVTYDPYQPENVDAASTVGTKQVLQAAIPPNGDSSEDEDEDHELKPKNLNFSTIKKVAKSILDDSNNEDGDATANGDADAAAYDRAVQELVDQMLGTNTSASEDSALVDTPEDEPGQCLPPKWEEQDHGSVASSEGDEIPFDCENDYSVLLDSQNDGIDIERGFASLPELQSTKKRRHFSFRGMFRKAHHPWAQELDGAGNAVPDEVINRILSSQQQSASPAELIDTYRRRKTEAFEDEPLGSTALADGANMSFDTLEYRSKFPQSASKKGKYFAKKKIYNEEPEEVKAGRSRVMVCLYFSILIVLAACAVLAGLYFSDTLFNKDGSATEMTIIDDVGTNSSTSLSSGSNLYEDDQVVACQNALPLDEMDRTYYGSNWKAFKDDDLNGCGDMLSIGHAAWYSFTTPFSRLVEASTCNDADFDTKLTVMSGSCGDLKCVTFNDEYCGHQSKVRWYAQRGTTYYVMVHGHRDASGTFGLTMKEAHPHDDCYEAKATDPGSVVVGTTSGSHSTAPPKCDDVDTSIPGVWYSMDGTSGYQSAELLSRRNDVDGQVAVYRSMDEADAGCGALICDSGSSNGQVSWLAESNHKYYVYVTGQNNTDDGEFELFLGPDYKHYCELSTTVNPGSVGFLASTELSSQQNVPSCGYSGYHTAPGVWFTVEGTGEMLVASTCGSEGDLETEISVFSGGCGGLQCVGGTGEDLPCGPTGEVSWESIEGAIYHIYISGRGNRKGDFVLNLSQRLRYDGYSCNTSLPLDLTLPSIKSDTTFAPSESINVCPGFDAVRGVWHSFVGTGKTTKLSACNQDTEFEAIVSVFTGDCDGLQCVAHTTTTCGPNDEVLVTTHVGVKYYVLIHGPNSFAVGKYRLTIDDGPINDSCSLASEIEATDAKYHGSTLSAKESTAEECDSGIDETTGLFYKVRGNGETLTFSTCNNATDFDTEITVYSGTGCSQLTCVDNEDFVCGEQSIVSFESVANETYYVRVGGGNSTTDDVGNFVLDVTVGRPFFET
mmetsp:Transcript_8770/g.22037  ORF Transcript_8770/g.22037 Transcript_8770/m.22037 type:complete len:1589 (+) Transcript_8770:253-5019(+)